MNQIVLQLDLCIKNSFVKNESEVDEIIQKLSVITNTQSGIYVKIAQALGNFWFKLTHSGFNKLDVINKLSNSQITFRSDAIKSDALCSSDFFFIGLTIFQNKTYEEVCDYLREMEGNGIDLSRMKNDESLVTEALKEAQNGNNNPLKALFEVLSRKDFDSLLAHIKYSINFNNETKGLLIETAHKHYHNCIHLLDTRNAAQVRDCLKEYVAFLQKNPTLFINESVKRKVGALNLRLKFYMDNSDNYGIPLNDKTFIESRYGSKGPTVNT